MNHITFVHAYEEPNTTVSVNLPDWDKIAVSIGSNHTFLSVEQAERLNDLLTQVLMDRNFNKKDRA